MAPEKPVLAIPPAQSQPPRLTTQDPTPPPALSAAPPRPRPAPPSRLTPVQPLGTGGATSAETRAPGATAPLAVRPSLSQSSPFRIANYSPETVTLNWHRTLQIVRSYPEGAALFQCAVDDCGVTIAADFEVKPEASDQAVRFNWAVHQVPYAQAALWQISYFPFPSFSNGSQDDLDPRGLVFSGRSAGTSGFFTVDLKVLAERLPRGATAAIFHVRILPMSATGLGGVVGRPSNVMRVYYGAQVPQAPPFQFYEPDIVEDAPPVRLLSVEYSPQEIIDWPPGCVEWEEYRESLKKNFFEKVGSAFKKMWNFASESYQWAKNRVIELARALTLGAIPDEVLSFALDATLASVGIPPDIPNLDKMLSGSLDHIASEMAQLAVTQIPAADVSLSLGNIGVDLAAEAAIERGEAWMRERLQQELESKSREALVLAIAEMEEAATKDRGKVPCSNRLIPPYYRVEVENTGNNRLQGIVVGVQDTNSIYHPLAETLSLKPRQKLAFIRVPDPKLRDIWDPRLVRMEPTATNENFRHWWQEYLTGLPTGIEVTLPGHRECLGSCRNTRISAYSSPVQTLDKPYAIAF